MSIVKVQGNISGTGTLTIAAPNTNSDFTITLPAASGTLATTETAGFPSGTVMMFVQTAAPTGWTKSTTHDNKALRVVSGTAGTGGSAAFTTAFGTPSVSGSLSGTVGATTLTTAQIPGHTHSGTTNADGAHTHTVAGAADQGAGGNGPGNLAAQTTRTTSTSTTHTHGFTTGSAGGGGSHDHSFSGSLSSATATINVAYVDVIIATKD